MSKSVKVPILDGQYYVLERHGMQPIRQVSSGKMLRDLQYNDTAKEKPVRQHSRVDGIVVLCTRWCSSGTFLVRKATERQMHCSTCWASNLACAAGNMPITAREKWHLCTQRTLLMAICNEATDFFFLQF